MSGVRVAFYNRDAELAQLDGWWHGDRPEFVTVYGRRQVGKTELLVRFLADKRAIYFYADRQPLLDQLRAFTEQVLTLADDPVLRLQPFTSWEAALTYVLRLAQTERLALVIDEFSYATDADPALPTVLQRLWDTARRDDSRLMLVLCTSFAEAVERHFAADAPLYRRRTRTLPVAPFSYRDAARFFPGWSRVDQVTAWGIVGGVPSYLDALRGLTLADAVTHELLDKSAVLYREAEDLLAQEVRGIGPARLRGILRAIAYGDTEPGRIAQRIGVDGTALSGALRFLTDYGLVARRIPYTVANPERTRTAKYVIADNYLAFWFRFVLPHRSALEQGQARYVWDEKVAPQLTTYMGPRFEGLCREYIRLMPDRWTHPVPELGVWWTGSEELEIVGHEGRRVVLVAEAKWTNAPVGSDVLHTLRRRAAMLPDVAPDCRLVLFAKAGFAADLLAVRDPALVLVSLDDLLPGDATAASDDDAAGVERT